MMKIKIQLWDNDILISENFCQYDNKLMVDLNNGFVDVEKNQILLGYEYRPLIQRLIPRGETDVEDGKV